MIREKFGKYLVDCSSHELSELVDGFLVEDGNLLELIKQGLPCKEIIVKIGNDIFYPIARMEFNSYVYYIYQYCDLGDFSMVAFELIFDGTNISCVAS